MATTDDRSLNIREFCLAEGLSPPTYYELKRRGLGPREMRIGCAVRISHRARLDWQRKMEKRVSGPDERVAKARANKAIQARYRGATA